ncbi:hypothetical protein EC99P1_00002 [Enterococcus phage EC99P1]|nr:hypothetical protein EC99P1_00002 [Enterococcus phage EC99P1]
MKPNRSLDEWDKVAKAYENELTAKYGEGVLEDFDLLLNAVAAGIITHSINQGCIEGTLDVLNNKQDEAEYGIVEGD